MKFALLKRKTYIICMAALVCLVVGTGFAVNAMTFSTFTSGDKAIYYILMYKDATDALESNVQQHISEIAMNVAVRNEFNSAIKDMNARYFSCGYSGVLLTPQGMANFSVSGSIWNENGKFILGWSASLDPDTFKILNCLIYPPTWFGPDDGRIQIPQLSESTYYVLPELDGNAPQS